ncbi:MAG: leucine-rich repeat protein [Ruminococcus sp.]
MRKLRYLSLVLAVLLVFCSVFSAMSLNSTEENTYGDFVFEILSDNTAQITGYTGNDSNVEIPQALGNCPVSAIGDNLFKGHTELKEVIIPDTVKSIGDYAFDCCTNLTEVTVPDNVTEIGKGAFFSCSRLNKATLSKSLETIGDGAFYDCIALQSISLGDNVTTVGEFAFGNCKKLQSASIGNSLKEISNQMFLNCQSLTEIVIPNSVSSIGRRAFWECPSLSSVTIPDTVTTIKEYAFSGCSSLESISTNAKEIRKNAFAYCSGIKSISFTDNLESIKENAFEGSSLNTLNIPAGVTHIAYGAFAVSNIGEINVDENNKNYCSVDSVIYNKTKTEIVAYPPMREDKTSFTVPSTVTSIAPYAFNNCFALTSVTIGKNVKTISDHAFDGAYNLASIKVPSTVTSVGKAAFINCSSITNANFSANVKSIPSYAFSGCNGLKKITFSNSITKIGKYAFSECVELNEIKIPQSIKEVSPTAFYSTSIKSFTVNSKNTSLTEVNGVLFSKDKKKLVAYPPSKKKSSYTVPKGTKKIGAYAMALTYNLKDVTVPKSVSAMGKYAVGYIKNYSSDSYDRASNFMILGKENSCAEKYSIKNDLAFFTEKPSLKTKNISLKSGNTYKFKVNGADGNVQYTSSDESIATVNRKGKIKGVSKGETTVIAATGTVNLKCKVKVTNGKAPTTAKSKFYNKFEKLTIKSYKSWEKSYYNLNKNVSFSMLDNPNIKCYTGQEFIPIVGVQEGGGYMLAMTKDAYGEDYGQYEIIGDNLATELSKFKTDTDLVLFSGTDDVSLMTGKTSSLKDMKNAVGKRYTTRSVVSTSIAHSAATSFGEGSYHTMLEIYAPASAIKGGYIRKVSVNPHEFEILLDKGLKYQVLEAGVRQIPVTDFNGGNKKVETERYMKIKLLNTK